MPKITLKSIKDLLKQTAGKVRSGYMDPAEARRLKERLQPMIDNPTMPEAMRKSLRAQLSAATLGSKARHFREEARPLTDPITKPIGRASASVERGGRVVGDIAGKHRGKLIAAGGAYALLRKKGKKKEAAPWVQGTLSALYKKKRKEAKKKKSEEVVKK